MNGYSPLEHTLRYIICAISPSKDDWSIRFQLIEELRAVVEPIESLRGMQIMFDFYPFYVAHIPLYGMPLFTDMFCLHNKG